MLFLRNYTNGYIFLGPLNKNQGRALIFVKKVLSIFQYYLLITRPSLNNFFLIKQVCSLDVHKDSIFLCMVNEYSEVVHQEKSGVLTPDLERMVGFMCSHNLLCTS